MSEWDGNVEVLTHEDHGVNFVPASESGMLKATEIEEGTFESGTVSALPMARATMDALCFIYGYLEVAPRAVQTMPTTYSASTEGSGECSLV